MMWRQHQLPTDIKPNTKMSANKSSTNTHTHTLMQPLCKYRDNKTRRTHTHKHTQHKKMTGLVRNNRTIKFRVRHAQRKLFDKYKCLHRNQL